MGYLILHNDHIFALYNRATYKFFRGGYKNNFGFWYAMSNIPLGLKCLSNTTNDPLLFNNISGKQVEEDEMEEIL